MNLEGKKILLTGASSGLGRALVIKLIEEGSYVFGIARRKKLLLLLQGELSQPNKFQFSNVDISLSNSWGKILKSLKRKKFKPDVVIFNAAISGNDFEKGIDTILNRKIFETNYFSSLEALKTLLPYVNNNSQFIAISSLSAFKGSGEEGIGYAASKAALSISFESLSIKYKGKHDFKIVYFGPIKTGMNPFTKHNVLTISEKTAVNSIINAIKGTKNQRFIPWFLFTAILLSKNISVLYFQLLRFIDFLHRKNKKK